MFRADYILTCADGLSWSALAPFVRSVAAHTPGARLIVFAARLDPSCRAACREHGAVLLPFDALFPDAGVRTEAVRTLLWRSATLLAGMLRYPAFCRRLLRRAGGLLLPRNQARFFHYATYLEDCAVTGDRFLFCDARDVVLQSDPFANLPDCGVVLTEEEAGVALSDNSFNARWYAETYGSELLRLHADRTVTCAGVIAGERDGLLSLFDLFIAESVRRPKAYGADQAILNHLLYTGAISDAALLPNRGSLAWHLYGVPSDQITTDPEARLSQPDGHVPPIIHMYDRHPQIARAVLERWGRP